MKRRKNIPIMPFAPNAELPCMVPEGQAWTHCISNRTFKTRVIDLVLLRLPHMLLQGHPKRRLILDYQAPVEMRCDPQDGSIQSRALPGFPVMGEADLKFTRYAGAFGSLLVDSIDGDSIPIALMYHEMSLRQGVPPGAISVYRMELRLPGEQKKKNTAEAKKRLADGTVKAVSSPPRRAYEYVNIHALYAGLKDVIAQSTGRIALTSHAGHEMGMLISLIALTGTDFSRNMPQMSGRSVYQWLGDLWPTLAMAYDPSARCMRVDVATNLLVGLMYRTKFNRHVGAHAGVTGTGGLSLLLAQLQSSEILSARVKQTLPTYERVECTVRNANWVLSYWTCEPSPDPIDPTFGFRLLPGGCPAYADAGAA